MRGSTWLTDVMAGAMFADVLIDGLPKASFSLLLVAAYTLFRGYEIWKESSV